MCHNTRNAFYKGPFNELTRSSSMVVMNLNPYIKLLKLCLNIAHKDYQEIKYFVCIVCI